MFKDKVISGLINKDIFEHNSKLMTKIKINSFTESDFLKLAKTNQIEINNILIDGIKDNTFFSQQTN